MSDRLRWWTDHGELPKWQAAASHVFTMSASSAAAEHVFSLLQAAVHNTQMNMLEDRFEAMLKQQLDRGRKALQ